MSEKHLAERLMYPLPDGWQDDSEQVAALKEIWPKIIAKNKELIDAEITSLRAQLDAARRKVIEECIAVAESYRDNAIELGAIPQANAFEILLGDIRALLSESKT